MITNSNFVLEIETLCKKKGLEYIDAVILFCESNNIEVETAAFWIKKDPVFKLKIQAEAENLNILKRGARLPL
ncbi:Phage late-transcription coactivator [uncultured Caudovirales phage]|uniref:Phage late-transcription coactivator n=1 Tax=uncultured Caudovirales phage TaxID=2100421 RepID=A0A6J5P0M1_9CAUD|nr:Phage late-transcription coactivator [uncultured Caudovirales phage]